MALGLMLSTRVKVSRRGVTPRGERDDAPLLKEAQQVVLALLGEPFALRDHPLDRRQVRLEDLWRKLLGEATGERAVLLDEVLGQLGRVAVPREEAVEREAGPLLAARPRVPLAVVRVFGEERGGD